MPEPKVGSELQRTHPTIALVHDWMVSPGGSEAMLYKMHQIWPDAPIYTSAYNPAKFPEFANVDVRVSWLNRIPLAKRKQQLFTIPRALAFATMDLSEYDIVLASSSAESKYVRTSKNGLFICYCHTPIRYYWSDYDWYRKHPPFGKLNWLAAIVLPLLIKPLRRMDYHYAQHPDCYIANSKNVEARIKRYYDRDSTVIYPPIETKGFDLPRKPEDYYLIVGRQVAYKRLDLAVDVFNKLGLKLKVAGAGEEIAVQQARAGANIEFLGRVSNDERARLLAGAKGFIFAPEEDFGMVPVEAMAAGCPVIAYGRGGALEYIEDGVNGVRFDEQTVESLSTAIKRFETMKFDEMKVRGSAKWFDEAVFEREIKAFVDQAWAEHQKTAQ